MSFALPKDRDAFEAKIRAEAVSYRVHLFLGRGQWDRADAGTPAEALAIGAAMSDAHPGCQALPVYYAIEASGHATTIKPAQLQEGNNPMRTSVSETHAPKKYARAPIVDTKAQERKAANAERMREVRAKKKAVNEPKIEPPLAPTAQPALAASSIKAPRAGSDAEIILAHFARQQGCTRAEIEGALKELRKRDIKISMRSTALRFGETYGMTVTEKADKDGAARFFLSPK